MEELYTLRNWLEAQQAYYKKYKDLECFYINKEKQIKIQEVIDKINEMLGE